MTNFINRELSWLEFNMRVLQEAKSGQNPLLERIKYLSIVSSNLDEFFMVRVASIQDQINAGYDKKDPSGLLPEEVMKQISARAHSMVGQQYKVFNQIFESFPEDLKLRIVKTNEVTGEQKDFLGEYYINNLFPVLTPMAVDSSRPFPLVRNKSINIAVLLENEEGGTAFATVQVPAAIRRFVEVPSSAEGERQFILLEDIMKMHLNSLFPGNRCVGAAAYRITRNADLSFDEEEASDLLHELEKSLKKRQWGEVIRLEVEGGADQNLIAILKKFLHVSARQIYKINGPFDLTFLMKLYNIEGFDRYKYEKHIPQAPASLFGCEDIFATIRERDVFLHHPYESFEPVVDFIEQSAADDNVLAIKQTLYRVSGDSPIVKALAAAAESGKQVTVLLEVKARFEENNIHWAKRLEQAGCHVIYGLVGLKTHCKVTLVVRQDEDKIRRYVHLGTGNYNDITAKLYTDMGLFTCNEYFGADASSVFNTLSGYGRPENLYKLEMAPLTLKSRVIEMIRAEARNAEKGGKAEIIAKMNSLVDTDVIEELYRASSVGVKISLIVRGICCLRPGLKKVSENIGVRSIVGQFLEHSRIFYFYSGGRQEVFLSSADWMPRNFERRIELMFPIEDREIKQRILSILQTILNDTVKARLMTADGKYKRVSGAAKKFNSQEYFRTEAQNAVKAYMQDMRLQFKPLLPEDNQKDVES